MNRRFFTKIFFSICIVTLTGIFGLGYYYQEYYQSVLTKNEMNSLQRSINQANLNFDNQFKRIISDINYFFYYSHNGVDFLKKNNKQEIQETLEAFRLQYSDQVESAFFLVKDYHNNGKETLYFDQKLDIIKDINYHKQTWYKNFINKKSVQLLKPSTEHLFYQDRSLKTIYLTLTQYDLQGLDVIFVVRLNEKLFSDYYRLLATSSTSIKLTDSDDNVIYTSFPNLGNNNKYIKMNFALNYSGFKVKTIINEQSIANQVKKITNINGYIILLIIFLTLLISFLLSMTLVLPIKKFLKLMKKVETGDLSVRFTSKYNDEIGMLGKSFNNMIANLSTLIDKVYVAEMEKIKFEVKQKEARILALQNQINPHFLYNTLEVINCQAIIHDVPSISHMTEALAEFFRYPVKDINIEVSLQMELEYVNTYLKIQQERYPDIEIVIDNMEAFYNLPIVKLTLQPIVENAYKHAFSGSREYFLRIYGEIFHDSYSIYVEDNGEGLHKNQIDQLNNLFMMDDSIFSLDTIDKKVGIGLFNVHQRIRLKYGSIYGLQIEESIYGGTLVCINLPLEGGIYANSNCG